MKEINSHVDADPRHAPTLKQNQNSDGQKVIRPFGVTKDTSTNHTDKTWKNGLAYNSKGGLISSISNAVTILENDPALAGRIRLNTFSNKYEIVSDLPWKKVSGIGENDVWSDTDDSALRYYMEKVYIFTSPPKLLDAVAVIMDKNKYHPIRVYLDSRIWDGEERLDTLLIDWLGADDTAYVRAVTRKTLAAAVARIYIPGIKFDYMLTLVGPQGNGKSSLFIKLAGKWFSDSLTTVEGKEAYELLQGYWILELGELNATKKSDIEAIKLFISKQVDSYRVSYGRRVSDFPRQCIFIGTTNDRDFLRDRTGNRRYWPVAVGRHAARKGSWQDITQQYVDQVWAEAVRVWKEGEVLWLDDPTLEAEAVHQQEEVTEDSGKAGIISEYLDRLLPNNWRDFDIFARRSFLQGFSVGRTTGTEMRTRVCAVEINEECFGNDMGKGRPLENREIHDIMRQMPGWREGGKQRFGHQYGIQKSYIRIEKK